MEQDNFSSNRNPASAICLVASPGENRESFFLDALWLICPKVMAPSVVDPT
jgi:hypothetical protein